MHMPDGQCSLKGAKNDVCQYNDERGFSMTTMRFKFKQYKTTLVMKAYSVLAD